MREPERIDRILSLIKAFWMSHPDMRLGQLLDYLAYEWADHQDKTLGAIPPDVFYFEDKQLEEILRELLRGHKK